MIKAVKDSHDGNDDIDDEEEEKEHLPGASRPVWEALNTTALVLRIRKVVITFEIHIEIELNNHDDHNRMNLFKFFFERKLYPKGANRWRWQWSHLFLNPINGASTVILQDERLTKTWR